MYSSELKLDEIKDVIESLHDPGWKSTPTNDVLITKIQGSEISLMGIAFRAKGTLIQRKEEVRVDLRYTTIRTLKFAGIFVLIFPIAFLFAENVIIDGNTNPDIWDRLLVAISVLVCLALVKFWVGRLKNEFRKKVERDLKLTEVVS